MEHEFTGHYGKQNKMKPSKGFYKGRAKQEKSDKNPSQWSSYNKAPRIAHTIKHHDPLGEQLVTTRTPGLLSKKSLKKKNSKENENSIDETYLDEKTTSKLLKMSSKQLNDEKDISSEDDDLKEETPKKNKKTPFVLKTSNLNLDGLMENDIEIKNENENNNIKISFEINPKEEKSLELFMPKSVKQQVTLTDMILKKTNKNQEMNCFNTDEIISKKIPKHVYLLYKDIGKILKKWKSGNLPKGFKIIPQLDLWEEILYITNPDDWTSHVVYEATKLFSSQSNNFICQKFYNAVLLTKVRENILSTKKLDFHLYQAVKKSLFKPQAFFRGFLLPLCMDQCKGKEAIIIGGIIEKVSIPSVQSALAMYKLLELEYSGPTHYFIKILLNKRYALPLKVIDALLKHFRKFENDPRQMPVIWHQTLLVFVQRYKKSLDKQQKMSLKKLIKKQFHHIITNEIRKELFPNNIVGKNSNMDVEI